MITKGKNFFTTWAGRVLAAALMLTTLAACDSSSAVGGIDGDGSLDATVASIAMDLGFSADETAALSASFAKFGDGDDAAAMHEPGFLWRVAAELQATLSDEQKARLFERLERASEQRRGGQGMQQRRPSFGGQGGPGMGGQNGPRGNALKQLGLSDEQNAAIATIREAYKPQIEAILAQRETLTRAEIKEQLDALNEEIKTEVEGVLTDEQKAQLEELKAEGELRRAEREAAQEAAREEAKLVMIEVLGLTDDQVNALEDLRASAEAERDAIRALIESGADRDEVKEQVDAQREAHREAMASILNNTQYEITLIHQAISQRMQAHQQKGQQRPGRRRGGPGAGGPGFGGPGFGGPGGGVVNG